jgi:hypothetical protein
MYPPLQSRIAHKSFKKAGEVSDPSPEIFLGVFPSALFLTGNPYGAADQQYESARQHAYGPPARELVLPVQDARDRAHYEQ